MRRLFDTNAVIALLNDDTSKPAQRALGETPGEMAVSALVVHELFYGALKSRRAPQNVTLIDAIVRQNSRILFDFAHDRVRKVYNPCLRGGKLFRDHASR